MRILFLLIFGSFVTHTCGQELMENDFSYSTAIDSIGFEGLKRGRELDSIERKKYLIRIKDYPRIQQICGANFISQEWINDDTQFILIMCGYDSESWCEIVTMNSNYEIIESKQIMSESYLSPEDEDCSERERLLIYDNDNMPEVDNIKCGVIRYGQNAIKIDRNKYRIEAFKDFFMWSESDDSIYIEESIKQTSSLLLINDNGKMSLVDTLVHTLRDGLYKNQFDQYLELLSIDDNSFRISVSVGTEDCTGQVYGVLTFKSDNRIDFFANDCKLQFHVKDDKIIVEEKEPGDCDYHGHNCFFDGTYSFIKR